MKIWDHIPDNIPEKTALCIGKFDGFHSGHRLLIEKAKETGLATAVLTFVFDRTSCIDSQPEKLRLAKELGIDHYIGIRAGEDFFSLTPEEFIRDIVKKRLNADYVIVGEDFRFGRNRSGDTATLKELSVRYGYEAVSVKKLRFSGEDISSSRIRGLISVGETIEAAKLLKRPYRISGTVVRGNHIGEKIGYPTANIVPDSDKVLPPNGVYVVDARMISDDSDTKKEDSYTGIADLGVKPTISDDNPVCLEVNLFDGSHDLYDKCLEVDILKFIRPEMRFDNTDELTKQIENDIKTAKEWLEYEQIDNT